MLLGRLEWANNPLYVEANSPEIQLINSPISPFHFWEVVNSYLKFEDLGILKEQANGFPGHLNLNVEDYCAILAAPVT